MTDPTKKAADPAILAARAQQEAMAHKAQMDQHKNLLLGVSMQAPYSLDDALAVAVSDDEGFAKAVSELAENEDAEEAQDIISVLSEPSLRSHLNRVHAGLSAEWAMAMTEGVSQLVERVEADRGKANLAANAPTDKAH